MLVLVLVIVNVDATDHRTVRDYEHEHEHEHEEMHGKTHEMDTNTRFSTMPRHDGRRPIIRNYQLPQPAIQYLTALVEAYDGIGLVRTLDEDRGIIECWLMPDFVEEYEQIVRSVAEQWPIQLLAAEFE